MESVGRLLGAQFVPFEIFDFFFFWASAGWGPGWLTFLRLLGGFFGEKVGIICH